jgi:hypothetical protein
MIGPTNEPLPKFPRSDTEAIALFHDATESTQLAIYQSRATIEETRALLRTIERINSPLINPR